MQSETNSSRAMTRAATPVAIIIILLSAVLTSGCGGGEAESAVPDNPGTSGSQTSRTVQVETLILAPGTFEDKIVLIGTTDSPRDATLSAQSIGTLTELLPLGTRVREGDVIARIDPTLIEAVLKQAQAVLQSNQAQAALSEDTFARQEPLFRDSIISALEFEQVRAQLNQSRAQLDQAKAAVAQAVKQLENTYVRAPFDGTVETHFAEKGEQLSLGVQIVRLVDTEYLKVRAGVPERYAIDIKKGTEVTLAFKAYGAGEREGVITFVGNVIDPQNRSFPIEIEIDNTEGTLKPEMLADVFVTRSVLENQFVLPQTSILRDENGSSVYVVDRSSGNPTASRRRVTTGVSYGGETVISSGLNDGDEVIIVGQTTVTEGDLVSAVNGSSS